MANALGAGNPAAHLAYSGGVAVSPQETIATEQQGWNWSSLMQQIAAQDKLGQAGFASAETLANLNNAAQLKQLMATITGQQELAGINNQAQLGIAQGGWQNQLANTGLQNQGNLQLANANNQAALGLAGVNNTAQMGQLLAQIAGQTNIAGLNNAATLANTGLQNQGQQQLAGINNTAQMGQLLAQIAGQTNIAGLNNAATLANTGLQNSGQLANIGLQNRGQQQLAGINNQAAMQQLREQIGSQQAIAGLQSRTMLENTGLQNRGALSLAGVNNASALELLSRSLSSQEKLTGLNNENALRLAGINTAPALQAVALDRQKFGRNSNLLTQLLSDDVGFGGDGASAFGGNLGGGGRNESSQLIRDLIAERENQFTAMPQELFQQQLNQILGNSASALGGQLRSAQGAAGGAGMGANSAVARALQNQYGTASNANTQNSLTNAFLGKYNTDFQRQQAQAAYNQNLANVALGQTQQNQQYALGKGNLQLGALQNSTTRRGQTFGLASALAQ